MKAETFGHQLTSMVKYFFKYPTVTQACLMAMFSSGESKRQGPHFAY